MGYANVLWWALYDLASHWIQAPNKGNAPEKEVLTHDGQEFSPYLQLLHDGTQLKYCQKLSEWWDSRKELKGLDALAVQNSASCRHHMLLSEASPDLTPRGFFNCTIEVSKKSSLSCLVSYADISRCCKIQHSQQCNHSLCYRLHSKLFGLSLEDNLVSTCIVWLCLSMWNVGQCQGGCKKDETWGILVLGQHLDKVKPCSLCGGYNTAHTKDHLPG